MNEERNKNVPEIITPSESPTVLQASCHQSNQDDCKPLLLRKRRRLIALHAANEATNAVAKLRTQRSVFAQSTAMQERTFKMGDLNVRC
jgi:hypothetical protein